MKRFVSCSCGATTSTRTWLAEGWCKSSTRVGRRIVHRTHVCPSCLVKALRRLGEALVEIPAEGLKL